MQVRDVQRGLEEAGVLACVGEGEAEQRLWADCDLASLGENRLGELIEPSAIDAARREELVRRATEREILLPGDRATEVCSWLLEGGERVGTIALSSAGTNLVRLTSLYVLPSHRGRGAGARALARVEAGLAARGLGARLETLWSWQAAVRFYVRTGHWLQHWKHDLVFRRDPGAPPASVQVGDAEASISVDLHGRRWLLARAERRGERCVLHEPPIAEAAGDEQLEELAWYATSTLCVALALHGWPLVRSQQDWEQCRHADFGAPEALAYRIAVWEAWDRKHAWRVATPRIPGLSYPSWAELELEWARARAEREPRS